MSSHCKLCGPEYPLSDPSCANCGTNYPGALDEPITAVEAKAGLRALGFIGPHDLTLEEMKSLVTLIVKLEEII